MILVDTSVWIEHLQKGNERLRSLLYDEQVLCHPFVIGELACGSLQNRQEILGMLRVGCALWTFDKPLRQAAAALSISG